jgi:hypothetical protein
VIAAIVAGRYALRAKAAEFQAARVLELERRLATSKAEVLEPMVEAVGRMFELVTQGKAGDQDAFEEVTGPAFRKSLHWVQIYGADETVLTVHKMMQSFYANPPPEIALRLVGELLIAARRELGQPDTKLDALDLMGIRINDLYSGDPRLMRCLRIPEKELYAEVGWHPPWAERLTAGADGTTKARS